MAVPGSKQPILKFRGHADSVNCLAPSPSGRLLLSGGDDAALVVFDAGTGQAQLKLSEPFRGEPVAALAFLTRDEHSVVAASGKRLVTLDLRMAGGGGGGPAREAALVREVAFNRDEINAVAVHPKGSFLASCDDLGEVKVVNLDTWQLHKTLRGAHSSICSSACFHPKRNWEVFSGALDCQVLRWDFSLGRPLHAWSCAQAEAASPQLCNPPFVNAVAVHPGMPRLPRHSNQEQAQWEPPTLPGREQAGVAHSSTGSGGRQGGGLGSTRINTAEGPNAELAAEGRLGGGAEVRACVLLGVAKGDGGIHVYDADWREPPSPRQPKKGRSGRGGKGAAKSAEPHWQGLLAALGTECSLVDGSAGRCGHRAGVSHMCFGTGGGAGFQDKMLLLSGGNDSRVFLWSLSPLLSESAGPEAGPRHLCPAESFQNKHKVNHVALRTEGAGVFAYVADVSPIVKCYDIGS